MAGYSLPREAYDLLDIIAGTESPDYNTIYGGDRVEDLSWHPNIGVKITKGPHKGEISKAAGRYQFNKATWEEQANRLGLTDFQPESQDLAAWDLADREYRTQTGRELLPDIQAKGGVDTEILRALSGRWTSLPGGIEENARYRSGRDVRLADSWQTATDARSNYFQPIEGEERAQLLRRMGRTTSTTSPSDGEAPPTASPPPAPRFETIEGEERAKLLQRMRKPEVASPETPSLPSTEVITEQKPTSMADAVWENMKKAYGAADQYLGRQGRIAANSLGQSVMGIPGMLMELERGLQSAAYPEGTIPEDSAWNNVLGPRSLPSMGDVLKLGTPYLNTKAETTGEKMLEIGLPMVAFGAMGRAPAIYDELVSSVPGLARAGESFLHGAVREVPVSAGTSAAIRLADAAVDPLDSNEHPWIKTGAELAAGGLVPIAAAVGKGGGRALSALSPKSALKASGADEVAALQYALGVDDSITRFLPKGVTPDHFAEALRNTQTSSVQTAESLTTPQLMSTPRFRRELSRVSGVTVKPNDLNPFIKRASFFIENPLTAQAQEKIEARLNEQAGAITSDFVKATGAGENPEVLARAAPRLHRKSFKAGAERMTSVSDDLDETIRSSLGDTQIAPEQVASTVRSTLEKSDGIIEQEAGLRYKQVSDAHGGVPIVHPMTETMKFRKENIGYEDLDNRIFPPYEEGALQPATQAVLKRIDKYAETPLKDPFGTPGAANATEVKGMYREQAESLYRQINSSFRDRNLPDMDRKVLGELKTALEKDRMELVPEARDYIGNDAFEAYQQDFESAVSYWKQMKQLQGEKTIRAIQEKQMGGQWDLNAKQVSRNLLSSGDSVRAYRSLAEEAGVDPSPALRDSLAAQFDRFMLHDPRKGSSFDSKGFDKWYQANQDMMSALPDDVKASLDSIRTSKNSYQLQQTIRDSAKLKALLQSDPAEASSYQIIKDMLVGGQKGLNYNDFENLQKATGIERRRLSGMMGDALMYQLQTDAATHNPLTVRQRLDALTNNYPFLRRIYEDRPEIAQGIKGLQELYTAQAQIARVKMGGQLVGSNTANKTLEIANAQRKFQNTALGRVAMTIGFVVGGWGGNPLVVAGQGIQSGTTRYLDVAADALAKIYLDPREMARALNSPNMQKAIEDRATSIASTFLQTSEETAFGVGINALRSGRFGTEEEENP